MTSVEIKKTLEETPPPASFHLSNRNPSTFIATSDLIRVVKYVQIKRLILGEEEEATKIA